MPQTDPGPKATAGQIFEYLKGLTDGQATAWIDKNWKSLSPDSTTQLRELLQIEQAAATTARPAEGSQMSPRTFEPVIKAIDVKAEQDKLAEEQQRQKDQARTQATQEGSVAVSQGADPGAVQTAINEALGEGPITPDILKAWTGNRTPTFGQQSDLLRTWNEFHPDQPATNYNEVVKLISGSPNSPVTAYVLEAAFNGVDPSTTYEFQFGPRTVDLTTADMGKNPTSKTIAGNSVRISKDHFDALQRVYGGDFDRSDLKQLAFLADKMNITTATGDNGWQVAAAIAASLGFFDVGVSPKTAPPARGPGVHMDPQVGRTIALDPVNKQRDMTTAVTNRLLKFKEGQSLYGYNDSLAYLHALDPTLAARVSTTKREKLAQSDVRKANQLMLNGGWGAEQLATMGYAALGLDDFYASKETSGATGPVRTMPDPEQIKQSAKDLYRQLFAAEPSDAQLAKLVGAVNSSIMSADNNTEDGVVQDVNANAQIRKILEADPQYKDLYRNKPGGLDELAYRNQFENAAGSILGQGMAVDPNIIRSGMRQGNYNTAVGAAAGSAQALDNSTFLGRLAKAAQLINENT